MKKYNISYKDDTGDDFVKGCHIDADNAISALLEFNKKYPHATFYGMKLIEE